MLLRQLIVVFILLNGLSACQSPSGRLRDLQLDFFRARPRPATYTVVADADTLQLPLPSRPEDAEQLRRLAVTFRPLAQDFDHEQLDAAQQAELQSFRRLLDSLAVGAELPLTFDPAHYALDDLLLHFIGRDQAGRHPGLVTSLIEALPGYYQQIESTWMPSDRAAAEAAAQRALTSLDLLDRLQNDLTPYSIGYRERLQKALPAARYAMKDFIVLCESSRLQ